MQTASASKMASAFMRPVQGLDGPHQGQQRAATGVKPPMASAGRVSLGQTQHNQACECVRCGAFRGDVSVFAAAAARRTRRAAAAASRKNVALAMAEEASVEGAAIEVEDVEEEASQAAQADAAPVNAFDAVIEVGGTQQLVSEGRFYSCNSLKVEPGTTIAFERVLAVKDGDNLKIGQPYVSGAKVMATVLENYKGKKEVVFKMKPKKHYRVKKGHRQHLTKFLVTSVSP